MWIRLYLAIRRKLPLGNTMQVAIANVAAKTVESPEVTMHDTTHKMTKTFLPYYIHTANIIYIYIYFPYHINN